MFRFLLAAVGTLLCTQVFALNILLTNDDGFETENIQALHRALIKAGHDVVMSAPFSGQSGSGGRLQIMQPLPPTSESSEDGLLPAGSPPVGPTTLGEQQFYVDSTPAVAALYGIDVLAPKIFGTVPQLVISGPNEGNNLGVLTPHSGTLGATVAALNKGIPAIAVSANGSDGDDAEVVAALVVKVVAAVTSGNQVQLPPGVGLNVNTPAIDAEKSSVSDFSFAFTQLGKTSNVGLQGYANLGDSAFAQRMGMPKEIGLPGLAVAIPATEAGYPIDSDADSETNRLGGKVVTLSPIEGTYAANATQAEQAKQALGSLIK